MPEDLKTRVIAALRTVYDPEIPVNIYDLGLIYGLDIQEGLVAITMTLTAPNCPVAEILPGQVQAVVRNVKGVSDATVELTFDPPWGRERMSPEILMQLGLM
ncbi:MAG TPA: iron-sulfur cluster assembly protein [Bryobacteraceae bacterium]|nr:iron-sulfur cluster assembly protein [Bryobacteraceae bacterium]